MEEIKDPEIDNTQDLIRQLQTNASRPPIQTSNHNSPKPEYMPSITDKADHVYIKLEKTDNLGISYQGPFPIVDRPSKTTVTIRVGHTAKGQPRLETHHWDRLQIAHLRPDALVAKKIQLGRKRVHRADPVNKECLAPKQTVNDVTPSHATSSTQNITQPLNQGGALSPSPPAAAGDYCFEAALPQPPYLADPSASNQNKSSSPTDDNDTSGPAPPRPATSSPKGYGSHPHTNEPDTWRQPETVSPPVALADHDYAVRPPSQLTDHTYYKSLPSPTYQPDIGPPPGFTSQGRPRRQSKLPSRFQDFDLT